MKKLSEYDKASAATKRTSQDRGILEAERICARLDDKNDPITSIVIPGYLDYILTNEGHVICLELGSRAERRCDMFRPCMVTVYAREDTGKKCCKLYKGSKRDTVAFEDIKEWCAEAEREFAELSEPESKPPGMTWEGMLMDLYIHYDDNLSKLLRVIQDRVILKQVLGDLPEDVEVIKDSRLLDRILMGHNTRHPEYLEGIVVELFTELKLWE